MNQGLYLYPVRNLDPAKLQCFKFGRGWPVKRLRHSRKFLDGWYGEREYLASFDVDDEQARKMLEVRVRARLIEAGHYKVFIPMIGGRTATEVHAINGKQWQEIVGLVQAHVEVAGARLDRRPA